MKAPPVWLVRTLTRLTDVLAKLRRRMLPPHFAAIELGTGSWVALALSAFCELGLAEALAKAPQTAAELAAQGYGDERMLFRLLRALAPYDVVRYIGGNRFALGHIGKALHGPDSAAAMIRYGNASWHVNAYAHLAQAVKTGRPGFYIAQGMPTFDFFASNEAAGALFDAGMQSLTPLFAPSFVQAYDFSKARHIIDVGGGTGVLVMLILERWPQLRGTIFELPAVAERARELAAQRGMSDRLTAVTGNIVEDAPPEADAYILSHILHDWDDAVCERMLRNVRRAMKPSARVLICDMVAPPPSNRWSQDRVADLEMMAMLPGHERTREEFAALFERSGLRLQRVIPTAAAESILEAVPV